MASEGLSNSNPAGSSTSRTPSFSNPRTRVSKDEAWVIFRAGFMNASDGWNGEYPFADADQYDAGRASKDRAYLYAEFEDWFGEHCV